MKILFCLIFCFLSFFAKAQDVAKAQDTAHYISTRQLVIDSSGQRFQDSTFELMLYSVDRERFLAIAGRETYAVGMLVKVDTLTSDDGSRKLLLLTFLAYNVKNPINMQVGIMMDGDEILKIGFGETDRIRVFKVERIIKN